MTHSLHRAGSAASLRNDFVFIVRTQAGINREGSGPKLRRIAQILWEVGPCNWGSTDIGGNAATGLTGEEFIEGASGAKGVYCVFASREKAKEALRRLKEEDLGLSITVSGLISEVFAIGQELGLPPHTVNLSLGVHGRKELLPGEDVLALTTMCGHGMVSKSLAQKAWEEVEGGQMSLEDACRTLGTPCVCGIFNLERARELLGRKGALA